MSQIPIKQMDVIPPRDRSIRKIPIERETLGRVTFRSQMSPPDRRVPPSLKGQPKTSGKWIALIIAIFLVAGLLFSTVFASAKIIINPKHETVSFDSTITAIKGASKLPFEIMTLEREDNVEIEATGEENVEDRASGEIVVYNNHSAEPQRLIKNTRFETPSGLIFRIQDSIVIPGKTNISPGSIEARVFADAPGDKYNTDLVDWTLPAYKNDPQYKTIYARSKTKMEGGFIGIRKTVKEGEKLTARDALREDIKTELYKEAIQSKTEGFILYNDAMFVAFEDLPDTTNGDQVNIKQKGILYGILFDKNLLSKFIAEKSLANYSGEEIKVDNLEALDFTVENKTDARPYITGNITFTLLGNPLLVWEFDEARLINEAAGKNKKEVRAILTTFSSIESAELKIMPPWRLTFPKGVSKIKIIQKLED